MSNPEKLIQALSHMSMLSPAAYYNLCYLFFDVNTTEMLTTNYENNFKIIKSNNYNIPHEEMLDSLFNHNELSEEAKCFFLQNYNIIEPYYYSKYCPHVELLINDMAPTPT